MGLLLSCTALAKSFGSRTLFENISLGISEGERLGLIGPNGSGKSTLLQILAGRLEPDSGVISTAPADPRRLRGAEFRTSIRQDRGRGGSRSRRRAGDRKRPSAPRASHVTLGRAGFTDPGAPRRIAFRRLEAAPRHRARTGAGARHPLPRRAHQSPRHRRHPLARKAACQPPRSRAWWSATTASSSKTSSTTWPS